ncbi:Uncharacterised protein [Serratia marcescens]|nr:Uncharacterised protein [Serratia marcescens]
MFCKKIAVKRSSAGEDQSLRVVFLTIFKQQNIKFKNQPCSICNNISKFIMEMIGFAPKRFHYIFLNNREQPEIICIAWNCH